MTDIFTLGLKADTSDIDKGADSLDDFANSAGKADKSAGQFREGVNSAGKAIAAFGVAGAAALGAITVKAGNAAFEITNLSKIANLSVEGFQQATFAAQAYGVEQDKLADILKDTQDKVGDFLTTGAGPMVDFFEKIAPKVGVTAENFKNLNGKDALQLYASSLEKANVSQSEMVFYMEAIASDATLLQPLLANNGAEFERLADRADELGLVLSELDVSNLNIMQTSLRELGAQSEATSNVIGATLAPFVTDLTDRLLENSFSAETVREKITELVEVGTSVAGVYADAAHVFEIFGKALGATAFTVAEAFGTIDMRLDQMGVSFSLTFDELQLELIQWVNEQEKELARWATSMINAADVFDIFDDIKIEPQLIDTEEVEASIAKLKSQAAGLEQSLVQSNKNIADAWNDVHEALMQPLPSDGMDKWVKGIVKAVTAQKDLQKEISATARAEKNSAKSIASNNDKKISMISELSKAQSSLSSVYRDNEVAAEALHKVNLAIGIAEQAMLINKIAAESAATQTHLANSALKSQANAVEAVTSAATAPFPAGFAAAAAMMGLMGSLVGSFGGGSGFTDPTAARQESQGTGTVFGSDEKSQSIIDAQHRYEDISIDQLAELRAIRASNKQTADGITALTKTIFSLDGGSSNLFTDEQKYGIISDSGLSFGSRTLGESRLGADVSAYADLDWNGFDFGTANIDISNQLSESVGVIFDGIGTAISESTNSLGLVLNSSINDFIVDIGDVSLEGLSAEEVEKELQAIFSTQADLITKELVPSMEQYIGIGETAYDTLLRVSSEQAVFNDAISQMGMDLSDLSKIMQIEVAQSIIDIAGGAEKFSSLTGNFFNEFFTEAEQFEHLSGSLTEAVEGLGLSMFDSRDAYRQAVEAQDLATEAGREMYVSLLELTPAMAEYFDALEDGAKRASEAMAATEKDLADAERAAEEESIVSADFAAARAASEELAAAEKALAETAREAATELEAAGREMAAATKLLQRSATSSLSTLSKAVATEQKAITKQLNEDLRGIEQVFDAHRVAVDESTRAQISAINSQIAAVATLGDLTGAAESALSGLGKSVQKEQLYLAKSLADDMASIASEFDSKREESQSKVSGQVDSLERQASAVRDTVDGLRELALVISGATSTLIKQSREQAREIVFGAISGGQFNVESLTSAVKSLADIDSGGFSSALDLQTEQARTNDQLKQLGEITEDRVSTAEHNLQLISTQTETIERMGEKQITTLNAQQLEREQSAQARHDAELEALSLIEQSARDQLESMLGIDSSIKSISDSQKIFSSALIELGKAEKNAVIVDTLNEQIKLVETQYERELSELDARQSEQEIAAQSRHDDDQQVLIAMQETAREQLDALLGIDTGVRSLAEAQQEFAAAIENLKADSATAQEKAVNNIPIKSLDDLLNYRPTYSNVDWRSSNNEKTNGDFSNDDVLKAIAVSSAKTAKLLDRWDGDGQPDIRSAS